MNGKRAQFVLRALILLLSSLISFPLRAQVPGAVLSGTITDPLGKVVPEASISIKNMATGQSTETKTDSAGRYDVQNLTPGDYEVSASAEGFSATVTKVTIPAIGQQTTNLTLRNVLSLGDLGFPLTQTQGSPQDQALLDKRSHMLKMHQTFGLITTVPLLATVITGSSAASKTSSRGNRNLHAILGTVTVGLYSTSAYYAIAAPKIEGTQTRGNIRLHKALAWVHGAGMILTPILGEMAYQQRNRGEKVHGIASAHGAVAITTVVAYGIAILTESFK